MKKFGFVLMVSLVIFAGPALADSYTYTKAVTNAQPISYSDPLPISGWLDRIEVVQSSSNATVTVATYDSTTAVDTFCTLSDLYGNKVVRPRLIGTTTAGVNIAAVVGAGSDALTNLVTTVLSAPYERPMLGGNLKVAVTGGTIAAGAENTVKVTVFYDRTAR